MIAKPDPIVITADLTEAVAWIFLIGRFDSSGPDKQSSLSQQHMAAIVSEEIKISL